MPLINSRVTNSSKDDLKKQIRVLPKSQGVGKRVKINNQILPNMSQSIIENPDTTTDHNVSPMTNLFPNAPGIDNVQDSIYSHLNPTQDSNQVAPLEGMSRSYDPPYPKSMALLF